MNDTKKRLVLHSFYDRTGIVTYLEKQAENGWLLEGASGLTWTFRRVDPRKVHFAVTYFPDASSLDPEPSDRQASLWDFCEHAGWKLVATNAQMQIFCSGRENPVPIDTDAALEVEQIHASAKDSLLPVNAAFIAAGLLQLIVFGERMSLIPVSVMANNISLLGIVCAIAVVLASTVEMTGYFRWLKKARAAAEFDGSFVETNAPRGIGIASVCLVVAAIALLAPYAEAGYMVYGIAALALLAVLAIVTRVVTSYLKKRKLSAGANMTTTAAVMMIALVAATPVIAHAVADVPAYSAPVREPAETYVYEGIELSVFHDEIPLTVEDLVDTDYGGYSYSLLQERASLIAWSNDYSQLARWDALEQPDIEYSVSEAKAPLFTGLLRASAMREFVHNYLSNPPDVEEDVEAVEIDAAPWHADEAYQVHCSDEPCSEFLLYYDNRVVRIGFLPNWSPTDEQKAAVGEKLGLA